MHILRAAGMRLCCRAEHIMLKDRESQQKRTAKFDTTSFFHNVRINALQFIFDSDYINRLGVCL